MRLSRLALLSLIIPLYSASAASFTSLTVFGDSLSDNGNAYLATSGAAPGSNYGSYTFANGLQTQYFSDGPNTTPSAAGSPGLWVDKLASRLGLPDPSPVAAGATGTNYAVGGAETGTANLQDMGNQLTLFTAAHGGSAPASSLYVFWGGANDIFDSKSPVQAADNIESYIAALHGQGATNFLWLNLPLLGDTPDGKSFQAALNAASSAFNSEWSKDLAALQSQGISVTGVDIASLFAKIIGDPSAYGLTNVTDAAQGTAQANDAGYLFWDGHHPTTAGHTLVADAAAAALTPTPEPASFAFALIGVGALFMAYKRRNAKLN
jgi:phospholipase/lecithinase/hemolysin